MFLGSRARPVRIAADLVAIGLDSVGFAKFHNPIGLHVLL
jgi:xanthine/CO dehydrogenase XdhC/CoxF family maturation factor